MKLPTPTFYRDSRNSTIHLITVTRNVKSSFRDETRLLGKALCKWKGDIQPQPYGLGGAVQYGDTARFVCLKCITASSLPCYAEDVVRLAPETRAVTVTGNHTLHIIFENADTVRVVTPPNRPLTVNRAQWEISADVRYGVYHEWVNGRSTEQVGLSVTGGRGGFACKVVAGVPKWDSAPSDTTRNALVAIVREAAGVYFTNGPMAGEGIALRQYGERVIWNNTLAHALDDIAREKAEHERKLAQLEAFAMMVVSLEPTSNPTS